MMRPVLAYMLTFTILLTQGGLPLHAHYCKGMLESISVFFTAECDEHEEIADLPVCCKKITSESCSVKTSDCCDDEVKVLLQDFDSLLPHFEKWDQAPAFAKTDGFILHNTYDCYSLLETDLAINANSPPTYILFHSLIYYA